MPKKPTLLPPKTDPVWAAFRSPAPARQERKEYSRISPQERLKAKRAARGTVEPTLPNLLKPYQNQDREPPLLGFRSLRLEVVAYHQPFGMYECLCDCGQTSHQHPDNISSGRAKSCGCWHRENLAFSRLIESGLSRAETQDHLVKPGDNILKRHRQIHARWWELVDTKNHPYIATADLGAFPFWLQTIGLKPRPADEVSRRDPWEPFHPANMRWTTDPHALPYKIKPTMFGGRT